MKKTKQRLHSDVFITYRRDGGDFLAKKIYDMLHKKQYHVFMDIESLRSGNFDVQLFTAIDSCKDYLLVLSPHSLDNCINETDWVRIEIEYAQNAGKHLVLIKDKDFSFPDELPDTLRFLTNIPSENVIVDNFRPEKDLLAKPHRFEIVTNKILPIITAVVCIGLIVWFGYKNIQKYNDRFPKTDEEKQLVSDVFDSLSNSLDIIDSIYGSYNTMLQKCNSFLNNMTEENKKTAETTIESAYALINMIDISNVELPTAMTEKLENSKFDEGDITGFSTFHLSQTIETFEGMIFGMASTVYWFEERDSENVKAYILASENDYNDLLQSNYLLVNGMLAVINSEYEPLQQFIREKLYSYKNLGFDSYVWITDREQILKMLTVDILTQQNELQTVKSNLNAKETDLVGAYDELRKLYIERGLSEDETNEQIARKKRIDEKKETLTQKKLDLALLKAKLGRRKAEVADLKTIVQEKNAPQLGDTVDIVWNKMIILFSAKMIPQAIKCAEFIQKHFASEFSHTENVIPAVILFMNTSENFNYSNALIVSDYHGTTENQKLFFPGDIFIKVNGNSFENFNDFIALRGDTESTITVLRLKKSNIFDILTVSCTGKLGTVLYSLKTDRSE